jgi:hypothetical protein
MRNLNEGVISVFRDKSPEVVARYGGIGDETCGVFRIELGRGPKTRARLLAVASSGGGWDHVSVSLADRAPTWGEMDAIKQLFFEEDEVAVQYHIAGARKVDIHPNCLHLWRPNNGLHMPMPPKAFV